jgi:hypothetical protein
MTASGIYQAIARRGRRRGIEVFPHSWPVCAASGVSR